MEEFGGWIGAEKASSDPDVRQVRDNLVVSHFTNVDVSLVGNWVAATNLAATFDLAVHNLWTLVLSADGSFQLRGVETVSYPRSGNQGHKNKRDIMSGKWTFSRESSTVTLLSQGEYRLKFSSLDLGGKQWKRLEPQGFLPSVVGPMGSSPVFCLEQQD